MMNRAGHAVGRLGGVASRVAALALLASCGEEEAVGSATESYTSGGSDTTDAGLSTMGGWSGSTGWVTTGPEDPIGPCGSDPLCLPPGEMVPTEKPDGLPSPLPGVYDDQGPAPPDNQFRALIGFPTRQRGLLESRVALMYSSGPWFRQYMTVEAWMADHAPPENDVALVENWLRSRGFSIDFEAKNRLLVQFSGTVADFNATFQTELHICMRKNPLWEDPPFPVYCTLDRFTLPKFVAERTNGLCTADLPTEKGELSKEVGEVVSDPPGPENYGPRVFYGAYNMHPLFDAGFTGKGSTLGIVGAGTYHSIDLQIFWKSFGIERELPTRVEVMEPVFERVTETALDVQWATAMAPGAATTVYEGPDARNTSLLFTWNHAISENKVEVLTFSFAHREDSEPKPLRHQYDESALMGAALGMTLISASGDSGMPDTPCSSPYVTCVGGTRLIADPEGVIESEWAWVMSGSGAAKTFARPYWQDGDVSDDRRAMADLSLHASTEYPMWMRRWAKWDFFGGTSFAAPAFAGMIAVVNEHRRSRGLPRVGYLNPTLYLHAATRKTFRDIKYGETEHYKAGPGWDYPTGIGAPDLTALAQALP
ncbi:S53 family peptidase [Nannocystis radixulma]|uniref:S53 family serine peptidase n=1 Tax=Nannocystis radixulma TaxID=2995305 RepID=A0ABT5B163_9BACT|nr:S53 family serine peptidase [Nannocystis radixulma]MDC0667843.1 S53 family serine peptidase [Nannocystis radixulma]